ncbi:hypothetical protein [Phytoactinopolyspora limicola]|uniref:hypothetical protein n=1 Tax=Phytoactinopolyspora limicola TaxID=2715536 RepID=UPI00140B1B92|nr:hypothetical protein [Phytoactinopolyspora limicola]
MADQIRLVRPNDLLVASVQFENLVLAHDGSALVRVTTDAPAAVIVRLPPQHYMEPAIQASLHRLFDEVGFTERPAFVVPLLAGGGARFEWTIPDGMSRVEIGAGPAGLFEALTSFDTNPGGNQYDVLVNLWFGTLDVDWALPPTPDPAGSRHPLWRIRPAVGHGEVFPAGRGMNAAVPHRLDAVLASTEGHDHQRGRDLMRQAGITVEPAGVTIAHPFPFFQARFLARDLTATPLGGTASFFGPVPPTDGSGNPTAMTYEHRTSLGRDVFIRHATWGWLSSGHRAVVTRYTSRDITAAQIAGSDLKPGPVTTQATLWARAEIAVTEPVLNLTAHAGEYEHDGREIPFTSLRIDVDRTAVDLTGEADAARQLTLGGTPILFDLTGVDHAGRAVQLRMPLSFIPDGRPTSDLAPFVPASGTPARLNPTPVALAPESGRPPGSTSITVTTAHLGVMPATSRPVLPRLSYLEVEVDALAGLTQKAPVVPASLHPTFLAKGLDRIANPLGAMLSIPALELKLPTASIGGLGNPGGVVDLITAERGAVAAALTGQPPTPEQLAAAFPLPKLLGTIDLLKLLDADSFPKIEGLPSVPQLSRSGKPGAETLTYHFEAKLTRSIPESGIFVDSGAALVLDATITRSGPNGVTATSKGTVTGVRFELAKAVRLRFAKIRFVTDAGGKTSVDLDDIAVDFLGAFEFLGEIARRLAGLTGGSGARIDVDEKGVTAGFQLAVPTLAVGVMQLSNLSIDAFLRVPLSDGPLSFTLDVARRERPFQCTVSMFGGGGYLSLEVTPAGLRRLEAAIEFGGSMSLDIVVASGGVSVMAGVYFGLRQEGGTQSLEFVAYVRASGHLTVLGIVSIFVEFRLALACKEVTVGGSKHAMLSGTASVTVGVKVLFFSKSVTLTVTRQFLGSAADPSFAECFADDDWDEYCLAYAGSVIPALPGDPFGGGAIV